MIISKGFRDYWSKIKIISHWVFPFVLKKGDSFFEIKKGIIQVNREYKKCRKKIGKKRLNKGFCFFYPNW